MKPAFSSRQALLFRVMEYFVHILQSEKEGSHYIGHTSDLVERPKRHNQGRSTYTRGKAPWKLVYQEVCGSRSEAMRREKEIKGKKGREYINYLVRTSRA